MFSLYTISIIVNIFTMLIMLAIVSSDKILANKPKKGFIVVFCLLIVVSAAQWISIFSESWGPNYRYMTILSMIIVLSIAPAITLLIAESITGLKYFKIYVGLLIINLIIEILSAHFGFIFYVTEENVYHRGDFYFISVLYTLSSSIVLYISAYKLSKQYQNRNNYLLIFILLLLFSGTVIQMFSITIIWVISGIATLLVYIYYYSVITQTDALTSLLNRTSYKNHLVSLRKDSIIIYFDVNNFKGINDTYGHPYGDYCLVQIAKVIKKTYAYAGSCYRIGGDEFCVILEKELDFVDHLNKELKSNIVKQQIEEPNLPGVSVGYGFHSKDDENYERAIDKADKMMYQEKNKNKLG